MILETASFKHQLSLMHGGRPLFVLPYQVEVEGRTAFADSVTASGATAQATFGDSVITDTFTFEAGRVLVKRAWRLAGHFDARLPFSVIRRSSPRRWVMPGVAYKAVSEAETGTDEVSERLTTVPSFLFLEDLDMYFAVFTQAGAGESEVSCARGLFSGPFAEASVITPGAVDPEAKASKRGLTIQVNGHFSYERSFYILYGDAKPGALRSALEQAWELLAFEPSPPADWSDTVETCTRTLMDRFWAERGDSVGFVQELSKKMFPVKAILMGAGQGGNVAAARAMYNISKDTGDTDMKRRALDIADFFLDGAESQEAVLTNYRIGKKRWKRREKGDSTEAVAAGMVFYEYMMLHRDSRRAGDQNPRWMRSCRRWADLEVAALKPTSAFTDDAEPSFSKDPLQRPQPDAAYRIWVLASLAKYFPGAGYRVGAERLAARLLPLCSEDYWYGADGPPSRDNALAMVRAFMLLHTLTGHGEYLDAADRAATLLLSYTYCADVYTPKRSTLGKAGFRTYGGAVDFQETGCLDSMTFAVALELLRLDAARGGIGPWKQVALAQIEFCGRLTGPESEALTSWPGCAPARIDVAASECGGFESAAIITSLSALCDLAGEFPDTVKFSLKPRERYRAIKKSIGRLVLYTGLMINKWS